PIAPFTISGVDRPLTTGNAELEAEVAHVEGEAEPAKMMDDKCSEDEKQDRRQDPKQPPKQGGHSTSYAHGAPAAHILTEYAGNPVRRSRLSRRPGERARRQHRSQCARRSRGSAALAALCPSGSADLPRKSGRPRRREPACEPRGARRSRRDGRTARR